MTLPQLILIPGLLNDAELWRSQVADLSDIARPVVADITRGRTLAELARDVLALAEDHFALVGFSLGGIVALEIMRTALERVTHLALLDTTMLPDGPDRAAERKRLISMVKNPGRFHGLGQRLLENYLAPAHLADPVMTSRVRAMAERLGPDVFVRQNLVDRPDSRATLGAILCPTLVLCGEHDALTPSSLHRDMAVALPNSRLVIVPDSGHLTPIEHPEAVTAALRQLLAR